MKLKLISMIAGTALCLQMVTAMSVRGETSQLNEMFPALSGIELSQQQQTELTQIRTQTRSQIENVLTPEQRDRFKVAIEQGEGLQTAIASMQLSPNQQTQLRTILQSTGRQVTSIITPEQRQQIARKMRSLMMQRNSQ